MRWTVDHQEECSNLRLLSCIYTRRSLCLDGNSYSAVKCAHRRRADKLAGSFCQGSGELCPCLPACLLVLPLYSPLPGLPSLRFWNQIVQRTKYLRHMRLTCIRLKYFLFFLCSSPVNFRIQILSRILKTLSALILYIELLGQLAFSSGCASQSYLFLIVLCEY